MLDFAPSFPKAFDPKTYGFDPAAFQKRFLSLLPTDFARFVPETFQADASKASLVTLPGFDAMVALQSRSAEALKRDITATAKAWSALVRNQIAILGDSSAVVPAAAAAAAAKEPRKTARSRA